jgi:hypothetical protein
MPITYDSDHIAAYQAARGLPKRTAQWRWSNNVPDVNAWRREVGLPTRGEVQIIRPAKPKRKVGRPSKDKEKQWANDQLATLEASTAQTSLDMPTPEAASKQPEERTVEEHAEVKAWEMFCKVVTAGERAAFMGDVSVAGFSRTAAECHKLFVNARNDRISAEIQARQLITLAEYETLHSVVSEVMTMWDALGPDLARELSPGNPGVVLKAIDQFRRDKLNPVVAKFMALA